MKLLKDAGDLLDWIPIHGYWSFSNEDGEFETDYTTIISRAFEHEDRIKKTRLFFFFSDNIYVPNRIRLIK